MVKFFKTKYLEILNRGVQQNDTAIGTCGRVFLDSKMNVIYRTSTEQTSSMQL